MPAVAAWLGGADPIGVHLSGDLDSSGIAVLAGFRPAAFNPRPRRA